MTRLLPAYLLIAVLAAACTGGDTAVPRRTAYPRVAAYDTVYTRPSSLPIDMAVNAGADAAVESRTDGSVWLTIDYPRYDARIYCTFSPVTEATVAEVIDNRTERMHLNAGASAQEPEAVASPGGYSSTLLRGTSATNMPLQFLAVNPGSPRWVVSGAVFLDRVTPEASLDSLRPMVDVLYRDLKTMLSTLSDR